MSDIRIQFRNFVIFLKKFSSKWISTFDCFAKTISDYNLQFVMFFHLRKKTRFGNEIFIFFKKNKNSTKFENLVKIFKSQTEVDNFSNSFKFLFFPFNLSIELNIKKNITPEISTAFILGRNLNHKIILVRPFLHICKWIFSFLLFNEWSE